MHELAQRLHANPVLLPSLITPLAPSEVAALVEHLKSEADRHWWINANESLAFADLIVGIGELRGDAWQIALGTMARGDAAKLLGQIEQGWQLLGQAGDMFLRIGDEVGWARTR